MNTVNKNFSWWPKLIIVTLIGFGLFIGNMVRMAMQTSVDLVSPDYYKKEIAYQQHLNQVTATQELATGVILNQASAAGQLSLVFPENMPAQVVKGTVHFFRPSNAQLDFELPLDLNADRQQHIRTAGLIKGLWRVQLSWEADKQRYFLQKDITIE